MIDLGTGVLTWNGVERRGDRYGAVYLIPEKHNSFTREPSPSQVKTQEVHEGERGVLVALVKETRESTHIGDLFHGLYPETPEVGERILLGTGTLFFEPVPAGGVQVGLRPDDRRLSFWLNPRMLYRAHEQTVQLIFEQDEGEKEKPHGR